MIELYVEGYCHKCSEFEPEVTRFYADGNVYIQRVTCVRQNQCRNISDFIREYEKREPFGIPWETFQK